MQESAFSVDGYQGSDVEMGRKRRLSRLGAPLGDV